MGYKNDGEWKVKATGGTLQFVAWTIVFACFFLTIIMAIFRTDLVGNTFQAFFNLLRVGGSFVQLLLFSLLIVFSSLAWAAFRQSKEIDRLNEASVHHQNEKRKRTLALEKMEEKIKGLQDDLAKSKQNEANLKNRVWSMRPGGKSSFMPGESTFRLDVMKSGETPFLTPHYLAAKVSPYLVAMADIQYAADRLHQQDPSPIRISALIQNSPISVNVDGFAEIIKTILGLVVRWRREHERRLAELLVVEKQLDIEIKRAEIVRIRAEAARTRSESRRLAAENEHYHLQIRRLQRENEQLRLLLQEDRQQLSNEIGYYLAPNHSAERRAAFINEINEPVGVLAGSTLGVSEIGESNKDSYEPM